LCDARAVYLDSSQGLHAGVSSWRRIEDNAIPGRAKICGSYVNGVLASDEAQHNGFDEAILLTEAGHVAEAASSNIFLVRHGKLITPAASENILEGITRASVMALAREELHLDVVERPVDRSELYVCDEISSPEPWWRWRRWFAWTTARWVRRDWPGDRRVAPSVRPGGARAARSLAPLADAGVRAGPCGCRQVILGQTRDR